MYGMTETAGGTVLTRPGDNKTGHVGGPNIICRIKLRDIPESGYLTTDNPRRGEVCFQGPTTMKGYYKRPEKTNEVLVDGWMHSGDVGIIYPNGQIQIIDRVKNIFKL